MSDQPLSGRLKIREQEKGGMVRSSIPLIGKIKVGELSENGHPKSLDCFRATGQYAQLFHEELGDEPTRIPILFWSDDPAEVCNERWEGRNEEGDLYGYSDGLTWMIWDHAAEKYVQRDPRSEQQVIKNDPRLAGKSAGNRTRTGHIRWKVRLTLRFLIPQVRVAGGWSFTTGGKKTSIEEIRNSFDMVLAKAKTVQRIPFDLIVKKVKGSTPGASRSFPVVQLVPNLSEQNLLQVSQWIEGRDLTQIPLITEEIMREA